MEAKDLLRDLNVWRVVDGPEINPRPPATLATSRTTVTAPTSAYPLDPSYDFQPQSTDFSYLTCFNTFLRNSQLIQG
jgi:hypothetical protein